MPEAVPEAVPVPVAGAVTMAEPELTASQLAFKVDLDAVFLNTEAADGEEEAAMPKKDAPMPKKAKSTASTSEPSRVSARKAAPSTKAKARVQGAIRK